MRIKRKSLLTVFLLIIITFTLVACSSLTTDTDNTNDTNNTVETYIVTFDTNGGNIINFITVEQGKTFSLPTPVKEGCAFTGWFTGTTINDGQFTSTTQIQSDITLYARWKLEIYSMIFITNGGVQLEEIYFSFGDKVSNLPKSYKEGYYQVGWYIDNALEIMFSDSTYPAHDIILHAKWVDSFTVFSNYMIENGTRFELPYHTSTLHDDGYYITLGNDISDKYNRERESLNINITFFDDGLIEIFGQYVFSDNSSMRLGIYFDYGNIKLPTKVDYLVYDTYDSRITDDGIDLYAEYSLSGWEISLYPSLIAGLSGSITLHDENAELLGNLIMLNLEQYCVELGIPMFE